MCPTRLLLNYTNLCKANTLPNVLLLLRPSCFVLNVFVLVDLNAGKSMEIRCVLKCSCRALI